MAFDGIFLFSWFLLDAAVVALAAWLVTCAGGHAKGGLLESSVAWLWGCTALVAGAGVILGETGGLNLGGFLTLHVAALLALAAARRKMLGGDLNSLVRVFARTREFFATQGVERVLAICVLSALCLLTLIAAMAQPAVADALTYHLPRIGCWLQDGRIQFIQTDDERLNFVASVPGLVSCWFILGTREGFQLTVLSQAIGGWMAVLATIGLARLTGLGRPAAILAGALLLGMGNVVIQFTAAQSDLFTTGVLAASFYLWFCALLRGKPSIIGGVGAGLALGAKGTLFYLAPSAIIWVVFLGWRHRLGWRSWSRTLIAALAGMLLFAGPGLWRNKQAYGDVLGPPHWVHKHHQGAESLADWGRKVEWNLASFAAQSFEPSAQPFGLREVSPTIGSTIAKNLPVQDNYTLGGLSRQTRLLDVLQLRGLADADVTTFGLVALGLFFWGAIWSLFRVRHSSGRIVVAWSAGVATFLLFFCVMQQWHPYAFRYFVLVAPWIAVVGAWAIERLRAPARNIVWAATILATVNVGWSITMNTHQAGWRTVTKPQSSMMFYINQQLRTWVDQLDTRSEPLTVALSGDVTLASFFRRLPPQHVTLQLPPPESAPTAEAWLATHSGWGLVHASRFLGREGDTIAKVWLFNGAENSPFSVAAYRRRKPGETQLPLLYRHQKTSASNRLIHELLIKTWNEKPVQLRLTNPTLRACIYQLNTPEGVSHGTLEAGGEVTLTRSLSDNSVSEVRLTFDAAEPLIPGQQGPAVELVQQAALQPE